MYYKTVFTIHHQLGRVGHNNDITLYILHCGVVRRSPLTLDIVPRNVLPTQVQNDSNKAEPQKVVIVNL